VNLFHRRCEAEIKFLREQLATANERIALMMDPLLAQRKVASDRIRAHTEAELLKAKEKAAEGEERRKAANLPRDVAAIARMRGFSLTNPESQEDIEARFANKTG
jgi:hypothetical protein